MLQVHALLTSQGKCAVLPLRVALGQASLELFVHLPQEIVSTFIAAIKIKQILVSDHFFQGAYNTSYHKSVNLSIQCDYLQQGHTIPLKILLLCSRYNSYGVDYGYSWTRKDFWEHDLLRCVCCHPNAAGVTTNGQTFLEFVCSMQLQ